MKKNNINGFTFYKNYYDLIKYLSDEERLKILDSIMKYMFDDEEEQLNGLLNGIWINLKMVLDKSKKNIENGKKGGAKTGNTNAKKTTEKQPKNNRKTTERVSEKQANNISIFLFLISNFYLIHNNINLKNKIMEFLEYKEYEKKEIYKERGMKSLLKQISDKVEEYGDEAVMNLIDESMANNWKGIIWERIKKQDNKIPNWFGKEIKQRERSEEDERELQELIRGY